RFPTFRGLHLRLLRRTVECYPFCPGGLVSFRQNIRNRHSRELVHVAATLNRILIPNKPAIRNNFELVRAASQGLPVLVHCAFGFGHSFFPLSRGGSSLLRLTPLCEFNERCKPSARSRKSVENISNVLRAELKLPGGKRQPEAVVHFGSLAFREIVSQLKIECAALVVLSPFMNGLKTAIRVLFRFLFLLFRVFGEYFRFAMGQCHGDFSQS